MALEQFPVEQLIIPVLTVYLTIAGILVLVLQKTAWEFLRPLLLIGVALLIVPPVFRGLISNIQRSFEGANLTWSLRWLLPPVLIAIAAFGSVRLWAWWRRSRPVASQRVARERERVIPRINSDDGWQE